MALRRSRASASLVAISGEPLIGIILESDGREIVRYFSSEDEADRSIPLSGLDDALALAGAWKDLDWNDMERQLDLMRHESPPSAPLSL